MRDPPWMRNSYENVHRQGYTATDWKQMPQNHFSENEEKETFKSQCSAPSPTIPNKEHHRISQAGRDPWGSLSPTLGRGGAHFVGILHLSVSWLELADEGHGRRMLLADRNISPCKAFHWKPSTERVNFMNETKIPLNIQLRAAVGNVHIPFWLEARSCPRSNRRPQITHLWNNNPSLRQFLGSREACA